MRKHVAFCSFEERLAAQRAEREAATAELGFKKPLTKQEYDEKKKLRLAAIGMHFVCKCDTCFN